LTLFLNILFNFFLIPFITRSIESHNGKEEFIIIAIIVSIIYFIVQFVYKFYHKKLNLLNFSFFLYGINLIIWIIIILNIECNNCVVF